MKFIYFLCSLVACLLQLTSTAAQLTCQAAVVPLGDYTTCYTHRATCTYDASSYRCIQGAPTTCEAYHTDDTGCTAMGVTCFLDAYNHQCRTKPPVCTTLTANDCQIRSDCHLIVSGNTCADGPSSTSCALLTTFSTCDKLTTGCTWDPYLLTCLSSKAEATLLYPCSYWPITFTSDPNGACMWHNCAVGVPNTVCYQMDSGANSVDNRSRISYDSAVNYFNAKVYNDTHIFEFDVVLPFIFSATSPQWWIFSLGVVTAGNSISGWSGGPYNSLPAGSIGTGPVSVDLGPYTLEELRLYAINFINTNHHYDFSVGIPQEALILQILGPARIGPTRLVKSIKVDVFQNTLVATFHWDMQDALLPIDNAASIHILDTYTDWVFPTVFTTRFVHNGILQIPKIARGVITSEGVATASLTQREGITLYLDKYLFIDTGVDQSQGAANKIEITYTVIYGHNYNPNRYQGPVTLSDIIPGMSHVTGVAPYDCYGKNTTSHTFVYDTFSASWIHTIVVTTKPRLIRTDGNSFRYCLYANATDRILDMGPTDPYPTILDGNQDVAINTYTCDIVGSTITTNTCISDNAGAEPDILSAHITASVYPQVVTTGAYGVSCGFLPTPTSTVAEFMPLWNSLNITKYGAAHLDARNLQLTFGKALTYLCLIDELIMRNRSTLTFVTTTIDDFNIRALDSTNHLVPSVPAFLWSSLKSLLSYTLQTELGVCPTCATLPACAPYQNRGCVGFSVGLPDLEASYPAAGYAITNRFRYSDTQFITRRLLAAEAEYQVTITISLLDLNTTQVITTRTPIPHNATAAELLQRDLGSPTYTINTITRDVLAVYAGAYGFITGLAFLI